MDRKALQFASDSSKLLNLVSLAAMAVCGVVSFVDTRFVSRTSQPTTAPKASPTVQDARVVRHPNAS